LKIKLHFSIQAKGTGFCARSPWNLYNETRDFWLSGEREKIVRLTATKEALQQCRQAGIKHQALTVRLIRVDFLLASTTLGRHNAVSNGTNEELPILLHQLLCPLRLPYGTSGKIAGPYRLDIEYGGPVDGVEALDHQGTTLNRKKTADGGTYTVRAHTAALGKNADTWQIFATARVTCTGFGGFISIYMEKEYHLDM